MSARVVKMAPQDEWPEEADLRSLARLEHLLRCDYAAPDDEEEFQVTTDLLNRGDPRRVFRMVEMKLTIEERRRYESAQRKLGFERATT
jgi:hypothetical protein